jgi:CBS domain-containing protein
MRPYEPISRIMTEAVVVIDADRPVSEVLDCFYQYPIHHLPVVRDGRLVGMLSSADVLKLESFVPKGTVDRTSYLDQRVRIEQLMRTPVMSALANESIADAAERLVGAGVHSLPVVDDKDRVLGIVTTTDIIRGLLHGPPRNGAMPARRTAGAVHLGTTSDNLITRQRPADDEYATALHTAEVLHVEERDPRHLGKTLLYLDQRRRNLEKVLELADRFLLTGQDEQVHALLLKAIHAAKRAEEHATGQARVPFPLE